MGLIAATLSGERATSARATLPDWGCWYADASVDREVTLSGAAEVKISDLSLKGTILSGGPSHGRSHFRVVAGAGGWGKTIPRKSYANDANVKASTVLRDAAEAVGETFDLSTVSSDLRVGAAFVRLEGPACRVLEQIAPRGWYVGEDGITRLGRRSRKTLDRQVMHGPVDRARGTVTIAAESIVDVVPGITVDNLEAVDVQHEIRLKEGLRSTIWGKGSITTSRRVAAMQALIEQLDPNRAFRALWEYRVVTRDGDRLNLQPVRVSTGMPDLPRVRVRPGVAGADATLALGSRVVVAFLNGDPGSPFVVAFEDVDGDGFSPVELNFLAGGQVGGEHVATVEGTVLLLYNTLVALMVAAGGGPLTAALLQPLLAAAIETALTAQAVPAPPGDVAQQALALSQTPSFAAATTPATTVAPFKALIDALSTKTANVSGLFPSLGAAKVKTG